MSRSICIVHGGDISEPSGGTNRITAFAKALSDNGFDIHLVIPRPKNEFSEDLQDIQIHTVPIKVRGIANQFSRGLLISINAKKIAKKYEAILQIEHSTLAGFATLIGCSDFVLDMHDLSIDDPQYTKLPFSKIVLKFIYEMERRAVKYASNIIVVSNPMKDFIIKEWNVPKQKIEVIPNGYYKSAFKLNDVENTDSISFLGTLHAKVDIKKIVYLAKSLKRTKIYIIGDGMALQKLVEKIKEDNIKNIVFKGQLPYNEALKFIMKSKVVIAPYLPYKSSEVSSPVKLFDYAALGKAIVADNIAEICSLLKENNAALISDPLNPKEFIENVHVLLNNEKLRKKISKNAKTFIKKYTWKNQGKKLVELYKNEICACARAQL